MKQPLLVHLIFHPNSPVEPGSARDLALQLHEALNDDPAVPGLRVPTVLAAAEGDGLPPHEHRLDETERCVVVALIDDPMVVETAVPAGRTSWPNFVWDLYRQCQKAGRRFIPVAVSENAWPLDERLNTVNFIRAFKQTADARAAWTTRAIVVELCRFLQGRDRGDQVDLRLFLSHSKADLTGSGVLPELLKHLDQTQPIKAWVDSGEIEGGSTFADEIAKGVADSALIVIATKTYGTRPWCRKEVLLAKRHGRPFVVVDALEGLDTRSFPYVGNAPVLRWTVDAAPRVIDLILKETLRHLHVSAELAGQAREGDVVMPSLPELATVVRLPKDSSVLYPDPPLGDEECEELAPLGHRLETPLQRAAKGQSLKNVRVVLSISESDDLSRFGLLESHLDQALYVISRQLLVRGAVLEYGGRLGSDSYTIALFDMVRAYSAMSGLPAAERIINDVGWPLPLATLSDADRAKYRFQAKFERIPRPAGVESLEPATFVEEPKLFPPDSAARRYAWARGMTAMREAQTTRAKARIVIGGKTGPTKGKWYSGRIPGVVEEALVSLKAGQPIYLLGAFGGAGRLVIDLLEGRPRPDFSWDFQKQAPHAAEMRELYNTLGPPWEDYDQMTSRFKAWGVGEVSARNRLTIEENRELFECRDLLRIVEILLEGLTRLP